MKLLLGKDAEDSEEDENIATEEVARIMQDRHRISRYQMERVRVNFSNR